MRTKAEKVKMIIFDVDGTLTDGMIIIDNKGTETKNFNVKDGFAMQKARQLGIKTGIITGRKSEVVEHRMRDLGVDELHQGVKDKKEKLKEIMLKYGYETENIAYMGDDINDLGIMQMSGFTGAPFDAICEVKAIADFISNNDGGRGAAREFIEYILKIKSLWSNVIDEYIK